MKTITLASGNTIVIGNNAKENFEIIDAHNNCDLWFHVHDLPSCHVVLSGANFDKNEIMEAAQACKNNSKYKNYKIITIDCVELKNVKKTNILGKVCLLKSPMLIKL